MANFTESSADLEDFVFYQDNKIESLNSDFDDNLDDNLDEDLVFEMCVIHTVYNNLSSEHVKKY